MTSHRDDRDILTFIERLQADPRTRCGYLGESGIEADLEDLDQPWRQTLRVRREPGKIVGAALVEWYDQTAEVYGPWAAPGHWRAVAPQLLREVLTQVPPGHTGQLWAPEANTDMDWLGRSAGWTLQPVEYSFHLSETEIHAAPDPRVVPAGTAQVPAAQRLHEAEFPRSYTSPGAAVDSATAQLLIAEEGGTVLGYIIGRLDDEQTYIDYLAVAPQARRQGLASALIAGLHRAVGGTGLALTVTSRRPGALDFYRANGWTLQTPMHCWRQPEPG